MGKKLLSMFRDVLTFKQAINITDEQLDKDNAFSCHGQFVLKDKTFSYIIFSNQAASFITVEFATKIEVRKAREIDVYKAVNKTNESCPSLKCVLDKLVESTAYLTFSVELSASEFQDLSPIRDMLDILPGGGVFFLENLKKR